MRSTYILLLFWAFLSLVLLFSVQEAPSRAEGLERESSIPLSQATPIPLPLPDWPLVFSDDFSNPDSGWFTETVETGEANYVDGLYHIAVFNPSPNTLSPTIARRQYSDFIVEVDAQPLQAPEKALYGLVVRYRGPNDFYCFNVRNDSHFNIQIQENDEWSSLTEWQPSSCIYPGLLGNRLAVVAQGDTFSFYANDCRLATISDSRFAEGDIGLIAGTAGVAGDVDVFFDNLRVYSEKPPPPIFFGPLTFAHGQTEDKRPIDPATWFPAGIKNVFAFSEYSGMFPEYTWRQEIWLDGELGHQTGPLPWLEEIREHDYIAFGTYCWIIKMKLGGPLPSGNYEVRWYANDELVQAGTFAIGVPAATSGPSPALILPTPVPLATPTLVPLASPPALFTPEGISLAATPPVLPAPASPPPAAIPEELKRLRDQLLRQEQTVILTPAAIPEEAIPSGVAAGPFAQAEELRAQGKCTEAIPLYQAALEQDPSLTDVWYGLGRCYYSLKDYEQAAEAFRKVTAARPQDQAAYEYLGRALYFKNFSLKDEYRFDEAIAALNRAMELDPQDPTPYDFLGRIYYYLKDYERAIPYMEKAIQLGLDLADPYYFRAQIHYKREEYAQAIPLFQKCIEVGGEKYVLAAYAYEYWGSSHYWLKEYENALEPLQKSISLKPDRGRPYDYLGRTYYMLKRYDEAIPYLEKAMTLGSDSAFPYCFRGRIHYDRKEYEQAIPVFQKCASIEEDNVLIPWAYTYLGWCYYKLERYPEAESAFLEAIARDQTIDFAYGGLGWVYYSMGRCPEAIPMFKKAIELAPEFKSWQEGLAECGG